MALTKLEEETENDIMLVVVVIVVTVASPQTDTLYTKYT